MNSSSNPLHLHPRQTDELHEHKHKFYRWNPRGYFKDNRGYNPAQTSPYPLLTIVPGQSKLKKIIQSQAWESEASRSEMNLMEHNVQIERKEIINFLSINSVCPNRNWIKRWNWVSSAFALIRLNVFFNFSVFGGMESKWEEARLIFDEWLRNRWILLFMWGRQGREA